MSDEVKPPSKKAGLWLWIPPAAVLAAFVVVLVVAWPRSDPSTRPPRLTFPAHTGWITSLAFRPDGKVLASGGQDGSVQLHNPTDGTPLSTYSFSSSGQLDLWPLIYSSDGKTLVAANVYRPAYSRIRRQEPSRVKAWDTTTGQVISEFKTPTIANRLRLLPDDRTLLVNTEGPNGSEHITQWDLATGKAGIDVGLPLRAAAGGQINQAEVSPDGKLVAACGPDASSVVIADASSGQVLKALPGKGLAGPFAVAVGLTFSPDGKTLAVIRGGKVGQVEVWDVATGTRKSSMSCDSGLFGPVQEAVTHAVFSPDGRRMVIGGYSIHRDVVSQWTYPVLGHLGLMAPPTILGKVAVVDTATGAVIEKFSIKRLAIGDIAFSPDGRSIAVSGATGVSPMNQLISIWDLDAAPPSTTATR